MTTATKNGTATRRVAIFTHDIDGVAARFRRMVRKGVRSVETVDSCARPGARVVVVAARLGSEAEQEATRLQRRGEDLARIGEAIHEGRAYLDTAWGRRRVVGYNDRTGDCTTRNPGEDSFYGTRTFLVCLDQIRIELAS